MKLQLPKIGQEWISCSNSSKIIRKILSFNNERYIHELSISNIIQHHGTNLLYKEFYELVYDFDLMPNDGR